MSQTPKRAKRIQTAIGSIVEKPSTISGVSLSSPIHLDIMKSENPKTTFEIVGSSAPPMSENISLNFGTMNSIRKVRIATAMNMTMTG